MNFRYLVEKLFQRVQKNGISDTLGGMVSILSGLSQYFLNPFSMRSSKLPQRDWEQIRLEMERIGLPVIPYRIDVEGFGEWLTEAEFPEYYQQHYGGIFIEKALEHFVGADLLQLSRGATFVDVAASNSPWQTIASRMYDIRTVAIDLIPPSSEIEGNILVTDGTELPFPDSSVDGVALHCSYEMFEGDSDSRLIPEVRRVLRPGGRMVILPLYMHHLYFAETSPGADRRGLDYHGAQRVWREEHDGRIQLGGVRFSRKYDVTAFRERVVKYADGLELKIIFIENEHEVDLSCYLKMAAVFEKI